MALFILLQAGTGLLMTLGEFGASTAHSTGAHSETSRLSGHTSGRYKAVGWIHHGKGTLTAIYRVLPAAALLAQTGLGLWIFADLRRTTSGS